ncbi:hypothetical protein AU468_08140 [Alkalispirochaeta sphaeroplastigenens]|uniref:Uncharacterized protein n=1 Tax=Alkalispirochaeta sphaeroplastigenens TaxID=1187066 RepID=A0A2S4JPS4_9SPIO|nr:PrsW family glutamic-type intramembrane protease [Alkalispirochaeta sphaeroplastigenens]POR01521.1 hypothetical protein AU468_08140 [Alkalispirochaeta sphaeroplastigenens]
MSGTSLGVNIPVLLCSVMVVVWLVPGGSWRDFLTGACAAVGALLIFLAVRRLFPGTGLWLPREEALMRLFLIALVEEGAKYCAVAPWRRPLSPARSALRGFGFASAEHLLFLLLSPGLFLRRLFLAGALHCSTALLYGRPWAWTRNGRPRPSTREAAPLVDSLLLLAGTGIHFCYNLLVLGLDAYLPI